MAPGDQRGTTADDLDSWVRDELQLAADASVEISEKPGTDPRCSPVVTEVAVTSPGETTYAFHIEHPLQEVTRMDLVAAIAFGGGH